MSERGQRKFLPVLGDYLAAARFLNDSPAEMVCLQHEFGIYGGFEERSMHAFLRLLNKPLVSILHTVIPDPGAAPRALTKELAWHSDRLVVMNSLAKDILARDYGISPLKVELMVSMLTTSTWKPCRRLK